MLNGAASTRSTTALRRDAEDRGLQGGGGEARPGVRSSRTLRSPSPTRARSRPSASRSARSTRTSTAVTRYTCRLVRECDIGCNYGCKNTLDLQLPVRGEATRRRDLDPLRGALVRAARGRRLRRPLRRARRRRRGTEAQHARSARSPGAAAHLPTAWSSPRARSARRSCCSRTALRSRASARGSGRRFGGNGDLLTFARRAREAADAATLSTRLRPGDHERARGPRRARRRRRPRLLRRGRRLPGLRRLAASRRARARVRCGASRQIGGARDHGLLRRRPEIDLSAEVARCSRPPAWRPDRSRLLGMGRDIPDGNMDLTDGGKLAGRTGAKAKSGPFFDRLGDFAEDIAKTTGAKFKRNPLWYLGRRDHRPPARRLPHGADPRGGRRRPVRRGLRLPGLHVADGSVMPGPVGPNPSLTIAALADRFADRATGEA